MRSPAIQAITAMSRTKKQAMLDPAQMVLIDEARSPHFEFNVQVAEMVIEKAKLPGRAWPRRGDPARQVVEIDFVTGLFGVFEIERIDFKQRDVATIAAFARDTHKFESHYLDWLIGPNPQDEALYRERSPLFPAERLSRPVIFFQGDEDPVVPPSQTEAMVEALRRRGITVGYFLFSGEQHGFRKAANIQRALDAELYFYAVQVFGTGLRF
jgi:acetyl esterase/lipase